MDDKILEILMELKEGQNRLESKIDNNTEEIKADIRKLDIKIDNIHEDITMVRALFNIYYKGHIQSSMCLFCMY